MAKGAVIYTVLDITVNPTSPSSASFAIDQSGTQEFSFGYSLNNSAKPYINNNPTGNAPTPGAYVCANSDTGEPMTFFGTNIDAAFLTPQSSGTLQQNSGDWPQNADTTAFVGLEMVGAAGTNFGWVRIELNATGSSATSTMEVIDCAYDTTTNETLIAGQTNVLGAPVIYASPSSQTNSGGATLTLAVEALASPAPAYQWEKGIIGSGVYSPLTDSGNISGSTTPVLTITNASTNNIGDYIVVVTNILGVAVSAPPATEVVIPAALITGPTPTSLSIYSNGVAHFSIGLASSAPPTIEWFLNGTRLVDGGGISGSGSTNLTVANLGARNAGNYSVVVTNIHGVATSGTAVLTVVPTTGEPYESAVLAAGPWAYYRLNETTDPATNPVAFDYVGAYNGVYGSDMQNGFNGINGPLPSAGFAGFSATNYGGQCIPDDVNGQITAAPWNLNTNTVTMTAWINPSGIEANGAGIVFSRGISANGLNFSGKTDASGNSTLSYHWNNDYYTYSWDSGLAPIPGDWSFVALVITPADATIYVYDYTAQTVRSAVNVYGNPPQPFSDLSYIGDDPTAPNFQFAGTIDEVAVFNRSLSPNELLNLYSAGLGTKGAVPVITTQPASLELFPNNSIRLNVGVSGTTPLAYQWFVSRNNVFQALTDGNGIVGSVSNTLTISSPTPPYFTNYFVVVTNNAGSVTSSVAPVQLVALSGGLYESSVVAGKPVAFYEFNETTDPSTGDAVAYDSVGGYNALYGAGMANGFDGITGPQPADGFPGFPTTNLAVQAFDVNPPGYLTCPAWNLASSSVTFSLWINPAEDPAAFTGLIFCRGGDTAVGFGYAANLDASGEHTLSYTWNNDANTYNWSSGLTPPFNQWSFVSLVVTPTNATIYLMNTNGILSATHTYNHVYQSFGSSGLIGTDSAAPESRAFNNGILDDVAVYNTALSQTQLQGLYAASTGIAPPTNMQITESGGALQISWNPSGGVLLQSTNLSGPWITNAAAVSPYSVAPTNAVQFYKVRVQ